MHKKKSSSGKNCIYTSPVIKTNQPQELQVRNHKSSHSEAVSKNGVLRNFAKLTGKLLCQSLPFLIKLQASATGQHHLIMLSVILLSMLMILIYILNVTRHLICGNNQSWLLNLNLTHGTLLDWGRKWLVDFNAGKTQLVSFYRSKIGLGLLHYLYC